MIKDVMHVTIPEALIVTIFGMAAIFLSLLIISYVVDLTHIIVSKAENKNKKSEKNVVQNENIKEKQVEKTKIDDSYDDDLELVAVITAAISAMTGTSANRLIVKNIRRVPDMDSSWSRAGKIESMR